MTVHPTASRAEPDGRWRVLSARLLATMLRPTVRPLGWGIAVAVGFLAAETLVVLYLTRVAPEGAFGTIFLLGVAVSLFVFLPLALLANVLAGRARLRVAEAEQRRHQADALARRQTALRRVATLVARGADPAEVYAVTVIELARGLEVQHATLVRFEPVQACTVLAAHDETGSETVRTGERLAPDGESIGCRIRRTGATARIDDYQGIGGTDAERMRGQGLLSGAGAPVTIDHETRGALIVGSTGSEPLPDGTEGVIGDFADLVSMAISNADTRAELEASRTRIVAASDQARRIFARDLHDCALQRIVALGSGLRTIEASVPQEDQAVRKQLDNVINGMGDLYTDLQELSRGIHPATLSKGGLGPALRALARRSTVPVSLDVEVDRRLAESIEFAAYYVVAEALTNAAKYSQASGVTVRMGLEQDGLRIEVADDGVGGATPTGGGSGLVALKDRVEAVSGRLDVSSPISEGTTLTAWIPQEPETPKSLSE